MDPCACALELLGLCVYIAAWLCALAATIMPQWLSMSTELLAVESYDLGLWETCVVQETGATECRAYDSLLGLPHYNKLARVLMCVSLAVGLLGFLVAVPGLSAVNSCPGRQGRRAKRALKITGGALGAASGVLCTVPVSYVAHLTVLRYFDETLPHVVPRWEFGDALFCGWVGGFLLVVAGALLISSSLCSQVDPRPGPPPPLRRYEVQSAESSKKRTEYV